MLTPAPYLFMYVVDRDFGFAPNPFHGICTLATCKPKLRKSASVGDWVIGMGGCRLKATGRCVFAMRVGKRITFDQYWDGAEFRDKRPVRNGSKKMMVGDNIYHRHTPVSEWKQEDSHHSLPDGSANQHNLRNDTQTNAVLVSDLFYYFGSKAPVVPTTLLAALTYRNGRSHRRYKMSAPAQMLTQWFAKTFAGRQNTVFGDPFDFDNSSARYSAETNKVSP
ncbi:MAG: hypothetical protein ACOYOU_02870 [Kiritimatiellia bacterium]